ncbi:MFS transporter [Nocardioides houyundeii]|uniref:MFS transporter n=1 Tax=Nocardioides houyundeii TaxID=2045452 RepID=UPI000C78B657|nr:MFS transporter [Nocardioides houyundeii]
MSRSAPRRPRGRPGGLLAFLLLGTAMAVPTLLGLLSVELTADLGLDDARLGLVVSAFWAVTAVAAPLAGRWVDGRGWPVGAWWGALITAASLLLCVLLVNSLPALLVVVALSGLGYAFASPTSNILVMAEVPPGRQASVLGLKQTAPPLLMTVAGAVLPALAHLHGWRPAMAVGLVLPLAVAVGVLLARPVGARRLPDGARAGSPPGAARGCDATPDVDAAPVAEAATVGTAPTLRVLPVVVAAGLGTFAVATLTGFAVLSLVSAGLRPVQAAGIVSGGSLVAVLVRVASGWWLDRRPLEDLTPVLGVMGAAVVALGLVAVGTLGLDSAGGAVPDGTLWQALVVVGVLLSLVAAWTWPALLLVTLVRRSAGPGAASGLLQIGSGVGSAIGPVGFGLLSAAGGRGWAWVLMAVATGAAMLLVRAAGRPPRKDSQQMDPHARRVTDLITK